MCNPVAIQAGLAIYQGYSQYKQGQYQQGVSKYNARALENEATNIRNKGTEAEMDKRRHTAELVARQRAAAAASGVDVDSGSAAGLQEDTVILGEVDALRIRHSFQDEARVREDKARLELASGRAAASAGKRAFATSVIGSAVSAGVADKWFSAKSQASVNRQFGYGKIGDPFS